MKKIQLFSLVLAAGLLMSCSDSVEQVVDNPNTGASEGYVAFSINLPTKSGTRASVGPNGGYSDGLASEYDVKDATLLIFQGTDEASATYVGTYDLTGMNWENDGSTQITQSSQAVAKVDFGTTTDNLYGLVILNKNGMLPSLTKGTSTLAGLNAIAGTNADAFTANGFFMTNSPFAKSAGGTDAATAPTATGIFTLAPFRADCIKPTVAEAVNSPAADVFVERAVAKVDIATSSLPADGVTSDANSKILKATVEGWVLDNTNTTTYLVRKVDGISTSAWTGFAHEDNYATYGYRFIDDEQVKSTSGNYRIHFAVDPNYASANTDVDADMDKLGTLPTTWLGSSDYDYCLENTFDVAHMTWRNTTRVIVKTFLTLSGKTTPADFWIVNGDKQNPYVTEAAAKAKVAQQVMAYLEANKTTYIADGTVESCTVTLSAPSNGYCTIQGITLNESVGDPVTWATPYDATSAAAALVTHFTTSDPVSVAFYEGGASYYSVRIKHFGDPETPWSAADAVEGSSYGNLTTGLAVAERDFLGRYGVLRNTWYTVDVKGIREIGEPGVPPVSVDTWDDEVNYYIAVDIYTQEWAKRSQDAVLQ